MAAKTITGVYPAGYNVDPTYTKLTIGSAATIGGTGVTTSTTQSTAIVNYGLDIGTQVGITLGDGGSIANLASSGGNGLIEGRTAINVKNGYATITNRSTIRSDASSSTSGATMSTTTAPSIVLEAGGRFDNNSGGSVSNGISIAGAAGRVNNSGTLGAPMTGSVYSETNGSSKTTSQEGAAINFAAGGVIVNGTDAQSGGILISGGSGTVDNSGSISGSATYYHYKYAANSKDDIINKSDGYSILMKNGRSVSNTGAIERSIYITGKSGSVINNGVIDATTYDDSSYTQTFSGQRSSIQLKEGGSIHNGSETDASACVNYGISVVNEAGNVINFGFVGSSYSYYKSVYKVNSPFSSESVSIFLGAGGSVVNGSATSTTAILNEGILLEGAVGRISNDGEIDGGAADNDFYAIQFACRGTIVNGGKTDSKATINGGVYVSANGTATVTNFGVISYNKATSSPPRKDAIRFQNAGDRLIEEGTGSIEGTAIGGGGSLILAGDAGAGTISGVGIPSTAVGQPSFIGFASIIEQANAAWTFAGATSIAAKSSFTIDGTAMFAASTGSGAAPASLVNLGSINDAGTIDLQSTGKIVNSAGAKFYITANVTIDATGATITNAGIFGKTAGTGVATVDAAIANRATILVQAGTLDLAGAITGTSGSLQVRDGATLELGATVAVGQAVSFIGTGGTLQLDDSKDFAATLANFGANARLDLRDISVVGETLKYVANSGSKSGTLTVTGGGKTATIALKGSYTQAGFTKAADGRGGSFVTYAPPTMAMAASHGAVDALGSVLIQAALGGTASALDHNVSLPDHPAAALAAALDPKG